MPDLEELYSHLEKTIRGYNVSADLSLIRAAFEYARDCHQDQVRKDGSPFVTHPLSVAQIVAELRLDTTLPYELSALKAHALPLLQGVPRSSPRLKTICRVLEQAAPLEDPLVPPGSLLREFMGGGVYVY